MAYFYKYGDNYISNNFTYTPYEIGYLLLRRANNSEKETPMDIIYESEKDHIIYLRSTYNLTNSCVKEFSEGKQEEFSELKEKKCKEYNQYLEELIKNLEKEKQIYIYSIKGNMLGKRLYLYSKKASNTSRKAVNFGRSLIKSLSLRPSSRRGGKPTRRKTRKHKKRIHLSKKNLLGKAV